MISAEGDAAQRALGGVVPEADPAVFEKPGECRPALQHVVHRLGEVVAARQLGPLLPQPALRIGDQGYAQLLPGSPAPTLTEEMLLRIERAELLCDRDPRTAIATVAAAGRNPSCRRPAYIDHCHNAALFECLRHYGLTERLTTTPLITGPVTVLINKKNFCSSLSGAFAT